MKTNILLAANTEDAKLFKKIQKEYKEKGMQASVLFSEMITSWKKLNEEKSNSEF